MDYILAIIALVAGTTAGFFIAHFKSKSETSRLEERNSNLDEQLTETEQKLEALQQEKENQLKEERDRSADLDRQLAGLKSDYSSLQEKLVEQKGELAEMQEQFKEHFENLANKILEEKSEKFSKQNKESLDQILNPLGLKLEEFKKKVEETYEKGTQERSGLREQIKNMVQLNQQMSEDAKNLTKALKGDSKAQGNYGEMILERVLEKSGLEKGVQYQVQEHFITEEGQRRFPDVVLNLPDKKYMIIDSKVSLKSYLNYTAEDDLDDQKAYLNEHLKSLRTHVKKLKDKEYQSLHGDKSPDFVIMFVANEPAYTLALQNDNSLFEDAFYQNVLIVSPTTLLATLSIIQNLWKREKQNANAEKIANRAKLFLDKFNSVYESLEIMGKRLKSTSEIYDTAMGQFNSGRGNLVSQAKKLKKLGAHSTKDLPESFDEEE